MIKIKKKRFFKSHVLVTIYFSKHFFFLALHDSIQSLPAMHKADIE